MTTYPNQRRYKVTKTSRPNVPKVVVDKADFKVAYQVMTKSELMLWLEMIGNVEDTTLFFSPVYYEKHYGVSRDTARRAFNSLIDKGFIREVEGQSNAYRVHSQSLKKEYDYLYEEAEKSREGDDGLW